MRDTNVLLVCSLGNPVSRNWAEGLRRIGYNIVILDWRAEVAGPDLLEKWGVASDLPIVQSFGDIGSSAIDSVVDHLGSRPDLLLAWCGSQILPAFSAAIAAFPDAKRVLRIETLPNASNALTEFREVAVYNAWASRIDGYIFYSDQMRDLFMRRTPGARKTISHTMIDPFLEEAYAARQGAAGVALDRVSDRPHVIFTGRADRLYAHSRGEQRDAVGPFLDRLVGSGVEVFVKAEVPHGMGQDLGRYPHFSNSEVFDGTFAGYISDFDGHLVVYNEHNGAIRRRVASSLSTRFALAVAGGSPILVTESSAFATEVWGRRPLGAAFKGVEELVATLADERRMRLIRQNLSCAHERFSFEAQASAIRAFIGGVLE